MKGEDLFKKIEVILRERGFDDKLISEIGNILKKYYDESKGRYRLPEYSKLVKELLPLFTASQTVEKILSSVELLEKEDLQKLWISKAEMGPLLREVGQFFGKMIFKEGGGEEKVSEFLFTPGLKEKKEEFVKILNKYYSKFFSGSRINKIREEVIKFANLSSGEEREKAKYLLLSFNIFPDEENVILKFMFIKSLVKNMGLREAIKKEARDERESEQFVKYLEKTLFNLWEGREK